MDPVSIVGAAASAATIVQLCTGSLNSLLRLQKQYKNADLSIRLLITQLSTLRTALSQISEWADNCVYSALPHVQSDLSTSLDGCRFLIETLNNRLSRLEYDGGKALSMRKKALAIWGEKERADFLTLLTHNIAALQLLLTAMQCRSQSEQMELLQRSSNRDIITQARDDTSSLLWLRDDESRGTRASVCTENSDLLDSSFVFDREIFGSRVYLTAMKSHMKRVVREAHSKAQARHDPQDGVEEVFQSEGDAQTITGDVEGLQGPTSDLQRSTQFEPLAIETRSYERNSSDLSASASRRSALGSWDLDALNRTQSTPSRLGLAHSEKEIRSSKRINQGRRRMLRMPSLLRGSISSQTSLDTDLESLKSVTRNEEKLLLVGNAKSSGSVILNSMELAYGELRETTTSENDSIRETLISRKSVGIHYKYRVYDVIGLHSKDNYWIYSFDEMSTLIYVVDISAYDLPASDDRPSSCIQEDLALFQQICSSKWLAMTPILLLLSSTDLLISKLRDSPLSDHFPDYKSSPADQEAAKSFFRQKFLSLNQKYGMKIWVVFTDSVATVKLGKVIVANVDKILTEKKILAF